MTPSNTPETIRDPPDVIAATLQGPTAVAELERERELIRIELGMLARLESLLYEAAREARIAELRDEVPRAAKRVPALADHVRETLSAYEAAVGSLHQALNTIAEFENAGLPYPFSDDELAELLELRNRIWSPPPFEVPPHVPAFIEGDHTIPSVPPVTVKGARDEIVRNYPRSYALLYEAGPGGVVRARRPGTR